MIYFYRTDKEVKSTDSNVDSHKRIISKENSGSIAASVGVDASAFISGPEDGIALTLSGGGYRAMLFHLGAIWRLNELAYLPKLSVISSVSGGSITAAQLAIGWRHLVFDQTGVASNLEDILVEPIRKLATHTLDVPAILAGMVTPLDATDYLVHGYQRYLFGDHRLQEFPDKPRFIINATNLAHATIWRFSKSLMGDAYGVVPRPNALVAQAVAASSAFPPFLSPVELRIPTHEITSVIDNETDGNEEFVQPIYLTDGGVIDNRGVPSVARRYRTILVSDGGAGIVRNTDVKTDWIQQIRRIVDIMGSAYDSTSRRALIESYSTGDHLGTFWSMSLDLRDYGTHNIITCSLEKIKSLANIPTRLAHIANDTQEKLVNLGYIAADTSLRSHVIPLAPRPASMPYPTSPCE